MRSSSASIALRKLVIRCLAIPLLAGSVWLASEGIVKACSGTPVPTCGIALVLAKASPGTVPFAIVGGTFTVPTLVYFQLFESPPGSGACPPGPYRVKVALTLTCNPPLPGGPLMSMVTVPVTPGFTTVPVVLTIPAAVPPSTCILSGIATIFDAAGNAIATNTGDSVVCIVDPAPGDPSVPRLDIQMMPDNEADSIVRMHPGDQANMMYRIFNNDPDNDFEGILRVSNENVSRMPGNPNPDPTGMVDVISTSDPGVGDHMNMAFADSLPEGACIPMPGDPATMRVPVISRRVSVPAGGFLDCEVLYRASTMCNTGTCVESAVFCEGFFGPEDPGLACTQSVVALDASVPPTYQWPDSGQAGTFLTGGFNLDKRLVAQGQPSAESEPVLFATEIVSMNLSNGFGMGEFPVSGQGFPIAPLGGDPETAQGETGRIQCGIDTSGLGEGEFQVDSFFDITYQIAFECQDERLNCTYFPHRPIQVIPGVPTGASDRVATAEGTIFVDGFEGGNPVFIDQLIQVSGHGVDSMGGMHDLSIVELTICAMPRDGREIEGVSPNAMIVQVDIQAGFINGEGPPMDIVGVNVDTDFRMHFRPFSPGAPFIRSITDMGDGVRDVVWDMPAAPLLDEGQDFLGLTYDIYLNQFTMNAERGDPFFIFPGGTRQGSINTLFSGAFHTWIAAFYGEGQFFPSQPVTDINFQAMPHDPMNFMGTVLTNNGARDTSTHFRDGNMQLSWVPEIYGTWLYQIVGFKFTDGAWVATPSSGPTPGGPSLFHFMDFGGSGFESELGSFFGGTADFDLEPGFWTFFLTPRGWDGMTLGRTVQTEILSMD